MKKTFIHIIRNQPLFPFLLVIFFVFHGYSENYNIVPGGQAFILALFYLVVALILSAICWLFFRDIRKACLFSFFLLAYQFFFGPVHDFLKNILEDSFFSRYSFLLPFSFLIQFLVFFRIRKPGEPGQTVFYLNSLLLILLTIDMGRLLLKITEKPAVDQTEKLSLVPCTGCPRPDIYLIIADAYPGNRELVDLFQFDNSPFENELKKRGFHIIDSSRSNYNFTAFSVASMLNMDYLPGIRGSNSDKADLSVCTNTLKKNSFQHYLEEEGYRFYNYSIFDFRGNPSVTQASFLPLKTKYITAQTFTYRLRRDLGYHLATTFRIPSIIRKYKYIDLRNNEKLFALTQKIAQKKTVQPKLVYTHLMMPHHPFYFDSSGQAIPQDKLEDEYYYDKGMRISYLVYSNRKFLELIDHILANSTNPPVILFLGDHGYREFREPVDPKYFYLTLNAILLPSKQYDAFYPGQTNVNHLRNFLNTQFRQQLKRLPDSSIFIRE